MQKDGGFRLVKGDGPSLMVSHWSESKGFFQEMADIWIFMCNFFFKY